MKKSKGFVLLTFVVLIALSCSKQDIGNSNLYVPTADDVTATATLNELTQGRDLYIRNCNSCHSLYSPDSFSSSQWKSIISVMGPRTGMSSTEISLVTKYVTRGK